MTKPLATTEDYAATARRAMSSAIRELMSALTFAERANADEELLRELRSLLAFARKHRSEMEDL